MVSRSAMGEVAPMLVRSDFTPNLVGMSEMEMVRSLLFEILLAIVSVSE